MKKAQQGTPKIYGRRDPLPESGSEGSLATPGPFNATHLVCISLSFSGHSCCLVYFENLNKILFVVNVFSPTLLSSVKGS